jgi:hypothetical protein
MQYDCPMVRSIRRPMFALGCLALLVCVTTSLIWALSYCQFDGITLGTWEGQCFSCYSVPGRLIISWSATEPGPPGWWRTPPAWVFIFDEHTTTRRQIKIPYRTVFLSALPVALLCSYRFLSKPKREVGACASCGYSLRGNLSGICPECGTISLETPNLKTPAQSTSDSASRSNL